MPLLPRSDPNAVPKGPPLLLVWVIGLVIITVCIIYYLFRDFLQEVISMWHRIRFNQRVKRAIQNGGVVLLLPSSSGTSGQAALRTRPILHELRLGDGNMRTEITKTDSPFGCSSVWPTPSEPTMRTQNRRFPSNTTCCKSYVHNPTVQSQFIARQLDLEIPAGVAETVWPIIMPGRSEKVAFGVLRSSLVDKG